MISNPMAPNPTQLMDKLRMMPDSELFQFAQMHKSDPYIFPLTFQESNARKAMRSAQQMAGVQAPKVVDQDLQKMAPARPMAPVGMGMPQQPQQALPEDQGIGQLPAQNMQGMAGGGIVGYKSGGAASAAEAAFNKALELEGITDPNQVAFLKSLHMQEGSGKTNVPTSNRGATGPMQILPTTFKSVAPELDINKPVDNMRGGMRYALQGLQAAKGDPRLAATYYYGGPGGLAAAKQGRAVSDPKNPQNPNTLQYGEQVAARLPSAVPVGIAQAAPPTAPATQGGLSDLDEQKRMAMLYSQYVPRRQLQPQSYGTSMGPSIAPQASLDINASPTAQTAPIPTQLGEIAYKETAKNAGLTAALPPDMQKPFERNPAPLEIQYGQKPEEKPAPVAPPAYQPFEENFPEPKTAQEETPTPVAEAAPAEEKKDGMDYNDMMIKFGLGLMAGKSPNALTNVGEAGMGALQMSMAEKKAAAEQAKMQAETELYKRHGEYYGQLAGLKGEQIDSRTAIAAEQIIANQMKAINANLLLTPAQKTQKEAEIRASVYSQLRPSAMAAAPNVGVGLPEGVTVKQVG